MKSSEMKTTPLTPAQYLGYSLLYSIPIIGMISRFIHRRHTDNINLKNYALSYSLAFWIKFFIVAAIIALMIVFGFVEWLYNILY